VEIPPALAEPPAAYYPPSPRLPALTPAELEHFDDSRLDEAYEDKLAVTGDDLLPISGAADFIQPLVAPFSVATRVPRGANGTAAAVVPAYDITELRNEISPKFEPVEIPELGDQPSETELVEYAKAHPNVQQAIRVFRAKIVEVKRS
jgi:hypothetical protein